jgi:hypothetical protein
VTASFNRGASQLSLLADDANPSAIFSPCGRYRYWLTRPAFATGSGLVVWVMLNPSAANAAKDDPTIRRVADFSRRWGCHWFEVVNLFGVIETDSKKLPALADPIGPENDRYLLDAVNRADLVVAAWGNGGAMLNRGAQVLSLIAHKNPVCFKHTKSGQPEHPLYQRADSVMVPAVRS